MNWYEIATATICDEDKGAHLARMREDREHAEAPEIHMAAKIMQRLRIITPFGEETYNVETDSPATAAWDGHGHYMAVAFAGWATTPTPGGDTTPIAEGPGSDWEGQTTVRTTFEIYTN